MARAPTTRWCSPRTAPAGGRWASGFAQDSLDIEGYARGLGRRRPDIAVTILRLANLIGPAMDTALSRYLTGPIVPTVLGRDARLQLLHEQDALGALERGTMAGRPGTFNIGADGIMMMSQAIRKSGRIPLPVPGFGLFAVDSLRRINHYTEINREQLNYLSYGRVMDTTRMRVDLGYSPKWTTLEAFDDYFRGRKSDSDHRSSMGTLAGESCRCCCAALGQLNRINVRTAGEG